MKKIMLVFGTRPEAIKMCPVVKELYTRKNLKTVVCVTGQHDLMLKQVLKVFDVDPDYNLEVMKKNQTLFDITKDIMTKLEKILEIEKPNLVLVHGDTTTSFASALSCFYKKIDIGHVEAGLRTYNIYSPYPEEFNRSAISILSKYNFAPTKKAYNNLVKEGISPKKIFITGNTAIDALRTTVNSNYTHPILDWAKKYKLIVITAHRRENIGQPMIEMFTAIKKIVNEFKDIKVIYPIHLNPKVREIANQILKENDRIKLIEPLEVIDFHNILNNAYIVLTDSGGIQEEAPSLGKPVLVMRDTTERPEGVKAGTLKLVGNKEKRIYQEFKKLLTSRKIYLKMSKSKNPYGNGYSSKKIIDIIEKDI